MTHVRALIWGLSFGRFFCGWIFPSPLPPSINPRLPARPAGGRAVTGVGPKFVGKRRARLPQFQKPEKVGPGRRKLLLPGVLSSISHRRNGGRRQASPRGAAPRGRFRSTARRVRTTGGRAPGPTSQPPGRRETGAKKTPRPLRVWGRGCGGIGLSRSPGPDRRPAGRSTCRGGRCHTT